MLNSQFFAAVIVGLLIQAPLATAQEVPPEEPVILLECKLNDEVILRAVEPEIEIFDAEARGYTLVHTEVDGATGATAYVFMPGPVICISTSASE